MLKGLSVIWHIFIPPPTRDNQVQIVPNCTKDFREKFGPKSLVFKEKVSVIAIFGQ